MLTTTSTHILSRNDKSSGLYEILPSPGPIVVGSGFGGAVAACRLAQAGHKPTLLERGQEYGPEDFPSIDLEQPRLAGWSWSLDNGLWDIRDLNGLQSIQAAGLGGGSLIYASVHLRPPPDTFNKGWPETYKRSHLDPYYDLAAYMLQASAPPTDKFQTKSETFERVSDKLGREQSVFTTPLAVRFEDNGLNPQGVPQKSCIGCGECNTGCPHQAKNTLDLNYIALARKSGAQVRTHTEVISVRRAIPEDKSPFRFIVNCFDHLEQRQVSLGTHHLFICAGAVGSTEILLRSAEALDLPKSTRRGLGKKVFGNSDAIAMVYDSKEDWDATRGPTITRGIIHRPSSTEPWFMVQNGGWPEALAPLFGVFRAEVLLGRNRRSLAQGQPDHNPDDQKRAERFLRQLPEALRSLSFSSTQIWRGHFSPETFGIAEPNTEGGLAYVMNALETQTESSHPIPKQVVDSLAETLETLIQARHNLVGETTEKIYQQLLSKLGPSRMLIEWLIPSLQPENLKRVGSDTLDRVLSALLRDHLGPFLLGSSPGKRSTMFLGMGQEAEGRRLFLNRQGQLEAEPTSSAQQETLSGIGQLMQELAEASGAELRLNPLWTERKTPVTVHAQGGVGIGEGPEYPLDLNGELKGCRGLYVLDAAAFPAAVGTNPSATITAIAERNIETFIRAHGQPTWSAPENTTAQTWIRERPEVADPLAQLPNLSRPLKAQKLELSFQERMTGFHFAAGPQNYHQGERQGLASNTALGIKLSLHAHDLEGLLHYKKTDLKAHGKLAWSDNQNACTVDIQGTLKLFPPTPDRLSKKMVYDLFFEGGKLYGEKFIANDQGFDIWEDTTTLFIELHRRGLATSYGIIRVSASDFFDFQLPSMKVCGAPDANTAAWALSDFGRFFFGHLFDIYGAPPKKARDNYANIKTPTKLGIPTHRRQPDSYLVSLGSPPSKTGSSSSRWQFRE